jgi:hypothetical protein
VSEVSAGAGRRDWLLRNLIWCELCSAPMLAVQLSTGRYYGCPYRECRRQLINAPLVEQLVWHQYALLFEGTDIVVPTSMRWAALRRRLRRVRIGEDLTELWYEWVEPDSNP